MNLLACLLIFATILYLVYSYIFNKEIKVKHIILISLSIMSSIIILCLNMEPPEAFDIYRHFEEMNYIRGSDLNEFAKFLFSKTIPFWLIFEKIMTLISNNNHVIYLFSIPMTIIPFVYILIDMKKNNKITNRQAVISFFIYFSIINTIHMMSGIRNALAVSILSIGMYLELFKKKKIGYLFYVIALLMHQMVILVLVFRVCSSLLFKIKIKNKIRIGQYLVIMWQIFSKAILGILKFMLSIIPISILVIYTNYLSLELNYKIDVDYRIVIPELIQIILLTVMMHMVIKNNEEVDKRILIFYYLGFFIIGSFSMFNIFTRTRFIFAYFSPFILSCWNTVNVESEKRKVQKKNIIEHVLLLDSIYINVFYIYFMYCNGVFI